MPRHLQMETTVAPENELVMTGNSKKRIAKTGAHHDFKNRSMTQKMSKDVDDKNVHTTGIAALRLQKKFSLFVPKSSYY